MLLRQEARQNEQGEIELWVNFGDLLDWLGTLPQHSNHPAAAGAAMEIKQMLLDQLKTAEVRQRGD